MLLAKPLFASLLGKAGSFLLGKAKNFLSRNIGTVKDGAIRILKGQGLQQTLKKTAGNIVRSQVKNLNKNIKIGENKLKKLISKKQKDVQRKIKTYGRDKYQNSSPAYHENKMNDVQAEEEEQMPQQNYSLQELLQSSPGIVGSSSYAPTERNYDGISKLYQS